MKITFDLISGLPKKELVQRIHFHQRQGEIAERALGFYLYDMQQRTMYRPLGSAAEWARKHLPQQPRPDKLILLARRLEQLPILCLPPSVPLRGKFAPRSTPGRSPGPKSERSRGSPLPSTKRFGSTRPAR